MQEKYTWIDFYSEFAEILLSYKSNRTELIEKIKRVYSETKIKLPTLERDNNIIDIDPFTVLGLFNKGITNENRLKLINKIKELFNVSSNIPSDFVGIPILNNQKATFYYFLGDRKETDIDNLWLLFEQALSYAKENSDENKQNLIKMLDIVLNQKGIRWNITMGLFWIAPYTFLNLDETNQFFIFNDNNIYNQLKNNGINKLKRKFNAKIYFDVINVFKNNILNNSNNFNDFPSFSFYAHYIDSNTKKWEYKDYDTGLTSDDWKTLLLKQEVQNHEGFDLLEKIYQLGGETNCRKIADEFGGQPNKYRGMGQSFARFIYEKTSCNLLPQKNNSQSWFPIVFYGRKKLPNEVGAYVWKIRDEISIAIDELDLFNKQLENTSSASEYIKGVNNKNMDKQPKNQILYGPPGTGKTYNTVVEAMKIIEPKLIQYDANDNVINYPLLKEKFDEYKKQGRIEFVTFHQSYSYEDFVEGLKPVLNAENIQYEKKEGVFKRICNNSKMISTDKTTSEIDFSKTRIFKLSLGRKNGDDTLDIFNYCIENNVIALGWGEDRDFSSCSTPEEFQKVDASWGAKAVEIFKNWMRIGDIVLISDGLYSIKAIARLTGDYSYRTDSEIRYCQFRDVEWLYVGDNIPVSKFNSKNLSQQTIYGFYNSDLENSDNYHPTLNTDFINQIITGEINNAKQEPYVLIIDEINRGNISKIFGELITLIEEDKRLGEANEVTVKLPYAEQGEPAFGVPSNLYIIGTMNTSDRSIASVDIALRRRFKFKEMMPDSSVVPAKIENLDFKKIFETLNTKIKILLDRDHQVGHSYFIGIDTIENLKQVWFDSIIPLLNEYFYGDWEKLNLVIPGFISSTKIPDYLKEACDEEYYYEFKTIEEFEDNNEFRLALTQEKPSENE